VNREEIIDGLVQLGEIMRSAAKEEHFQIHWKISPVQYERLQSVINRQFHLNGWFTKDSVQQSLEAHGEMLERSVLEQFVADYEFASEPKKVAVIMAGNLPLVGFHDFMCVLLAGHRIMAKLSSDDQTLLPELTAILESIDARFSERITIVKDILKGMNAVIATGSDNTLKYFEEYFGKYPHIFRRNRTSVAVLEGTETKEEIHELGKDIFQYFGLGCRNVSHILLPEGFDLARFFEGIFAYGEIIHHHKYANNYDYNRAVHLLNQIPVLENGFLLLKESKELHSALAMLHYHFYASPLEVEQYLTEHRENIQVIIGKDFVPFGKAQTPEITDFADNVDTMLFLNEI